MLIRRKSDLTENDVTPQRVYQNRRDFLQVTCGSSALAASTAVIAGCGFSQQEADAAEMAFTDAKKSEFSTSESPTEKLYVTNYVNYYEFGLDKQSPVENAQALEVDPWSVEVSGECNKPGTYALEDILKPHTMEERILRFRCVETWAAVIPWVGFSLGELLKRFEPNGNAKFVQFFTKLDKEVMTTVNQAVLDWPYREGLRMDEAMHPLATVAVGMYDGTMPKQNGAPLRLVIPWKYGFKSIKSIVKIVFTETKPETAWNLTVPSEYGFYANVNPKVSHPRWSQAREQRLGEFMKRDTEMFNGYGEQVASLYEGMDLAKNY